MSFDDIMNLVLAAIVPLITTIGYISATMKQLSSFKSTKNDIINEVGVAKFNETAEELKKSIDEMQSLNKQVLQENYELKKTLNEYVKTQNKPNVKEA